MDDQQTDKEPIDLNELADEFLERAEFPVNEIASFNEKLERLWNFLKQNPDLIHLPGMSHYLAALARLARKYGEASAKMLPVAETILDANTDLILSSDTLSEEDAE